MSSPRALSALVADDNRDAAETLSALLGHLLSLEVTVVTDGRAALQSAIERQPDILFLDIGMPGMTGWEVCERVRATTWGREAKIIAVTGYGQASDRARSKAAGFDRHCTKPMLYEPLLHLLRELRLRV